MLYLKKERKSTRLKMEKITSFYILHSVTLEPILNYNPRNSIVPAGFFHTLKAVALDEET